MTEEFTPFEDREQPSESTQKGTMPLEDSEVFEEEMGRDSSKGNNAKST